MTRDALARRGGFLWREVALLTTTCGGLHNFSQAQRLAIVEAIRELIVAENTYRARRMSRRELRMLAPQLGCYTEFLIRTLGVSSKAIQAGLEHGIRRLQDPQRTTTDAITMVLAALGGRS